MIAIDSSGLRKALAELGEALRDAAFSSAEIAAREAHRSAKTSRRFVDRTGALRASISMGMARSFAQGPATFVDASARHAKFVEHGTRAHMIRAKRSRTLRFVVNGSTVFARKVMHPGTKPAPFMLDAFMIGWSTLAYTLEKRADAAVKRFNHGA